MLSDDRTAELADIFRLLGDPTRLGIVFACLRRRRSVGDIAQSLGLSPSLVSHHLRLLRAARVLAAKREGRQVFYRAADAHVRAMLQDMAAHVVEAHR